MSKWYREAAEDSLREYRLYDVKAFHAAALRAYAGMRRTQICARLMLPPRYFVMSDRPATQVWCCKVADNTPPRVTCQDREIILTVIQPWLLGVCPKIHKGKWLSRALIYSFLAGEDDEVVPENNYICKASIGLKCIGKKANELHQMMRELKSDLKKEVKKEPRYWEEWGEHEDNNG